MGEWVVRKLASEEARDPRGKVEDCRGGGREGEREGAREA